MKQTEILMGMPITVEIADARATKQSLDKIFSYFKYVDNKFSTYKDNSEITKINNGELSEKDYSDDMKSIFKLAYEAKIKTNGYFDITLKNGKYDPSGLVKGWAIYNAAKNLESDNFKNFYINAGGDIQVRGKNNAGENWKIGLKNPFNQNQLIKTISVSNEGVATSGTYIRGQHIYNPYKKEVPIEDIVSLTVIAKDIYEADLFATAAFAMGKNGINFIEKTDGLEGYLVDKNGTATITSNFEKYVIQNA